MNDLLTLFKEYGPWVLVAVFLIYQTWIRENRMADRLDELTDRGAKREIQGQRVTNANTAALRQLARVVRHRLPAPPPREGARAQDDDEEDEPDDPLPEITDDSDQHPVVRLTPQQRRASKLWGLLPVVGILILVIAGCEEQAPRPGSAQDQAVTAQARASTVRTAASQARIDADTAKAQAEEQQRRALREDATREDIERAAATLADARIKEAIALSHERLARDAEAEANRKTSEAELERKAEEDRQRDQRWGDICRWIGLASVIVGPVLGLAIGWALRPSWGVWTGAAIVGLGQLVVAYGATITWLPLMLAGLVVLACLAWVYAHWATKRLALRACRAIDVAESDPHDGAADERDAAFGQLGKAVDALGWRPKLERLRGPKGVRNWKPTKQRSKP